MDSVRAILEQVQAGTLLAQEAERVLKNQLVAELGHATLDLGRKERLGFSEVVFCEGKKDEFLRDIFVRLYKENDEVLGTRATEAQFLCVKEVLPSVRYDPISRILSVKKTAESPKTENGFIVVCTAGTADIPVAEEAAQTAEFFGTAVERIYDVGVSGLHRLFAKLEVIRAAHCVIAVAGMEGALASVLGGLVRGPIIAVPTSIGYGAHFHGLSALLTMLNSCANGVAVVNIDNGYGAGYIATQIQRLAALPVKG